MKKFLFLFLNVVGLIGLFVTCDSNGLDCTNRDTTQYFILKTKNPTDSLQLDAIIKKMAVYYLTDGVLKNSSTALGTYNYGDSIGIAIYLNTATTKNGISYTCIQWSETEIDTIAARVKQSTSKDKCDFLIATMQGYNDSIWTPGTNENSWFTIVR